MWWRRKPERDDRDGVDASELIASFDAFLTDRTAQARRRRQDLAFFDMPLRRTDDPAAPYLGWAHLFLEPGAKPPLGSSWTVYRLAPAKPDDD